MMSSRRKRSNRSYWQIALKNSDCLGAWTGPAANDARRNGANASRLSLALDVVSRPTLSFYGSQLLSHRTLIERYFAVTTGRRVGTLARRLVWL